MKDIRKAKIAIIHSHSELENKLAQKIQNDFILTYPENADLLIVIGGDGVMLHNMHKFMHLQVPFYGINIGTVGFLMNKLNCDNFDIKELIVNIENGKIANLYPLRMEAIDIHNHKFQALAINEVSIFRQTHQAANFKIKIDGIERIELYADGALVATPAGSSAYNISAGGKIVPLNAQILSLTPICVFRPRRWNGALVPIDAEVIFEILQYEKRPVSAVADFHEIQNIKLVSIKSDPKNKIQVIFNSNHTFEERVIKEQFSY